MKGPGELPDTEQLLRLASTLVQDAQQAEDIVQDAWLRGLGRRQDEGGPSNAYLRTTIKNGVRSLFRDRDRRERREHDHAKSGAVPSTVDELQTGEFRRILIESVESLHEPYRTTITRRFFDDLTPKEIAKIEDLPDATVRSRLKRGLEGLRASLDRRFGRTSWIHGFVVVLERETGTSPLAPERAAPAPNAAVATSSGLPVAIAAGVVILGASLGLAQLFGDEVASAARSFDRVDRPSWTAGRSASEVDSRPSVVNAMAVAPTRVGSPAPAVAAVEQREAGVLLHVLDGRDGDDLRDIRIVASSEGDFRRPVSEGAHDRVERGEETRHPASPLVLLPSGNESAESPTQHLWVGTPGFAWQRVKIDRSAPSAFEERFVSLSVGADLVVHLAGLPAEIPSGLQLFVRDERGAVLAAVPVGSNRVLVDLLPAGSLHLTVGLDASAHTEQSGEAMYIVRGDDVVYGEAEVRTVAGATVEASLVVQILTEERALVRSSVSVSLPPNGFDGDLYGHSVEVRTRPFEDRLRALGPEETFRTLPIRTSAEGLDLDMEHEVSLRAGAYEVEVYPFCHRQVANFTNGGRVRVEVPNLAEVQIRMWPTGVEGLYFQRVLDEFHFPLVSKWPVDAETGMCRAWLVPGRYFVRPNVPGTVGSSAARLTIEVDAGWNSFDFDGLEAAARATILEIVFVCRGARIPFETLPFELKAVGHAGEAFESGGVYASMPGRYPLPLGWSQSDPGREDLVTRVFLTAAGEYELGAFEISSFQPEAARRVNVLDCETRRVIYRLEPR